MHGVVREVLSPGMVWVVGISRQAIITFVIAITLLGYLLALLLWF